MKSKREITYISIGEKLNFHSHYPAGRKERLQIVRFACVQEIGNNKETICRVYNRISEFSILRMAKIQEKLAQ